VFRIADVTVVEARRLTVAPEDSGNLCAVEKLECRYRHDCGSLRGMWEVGREEERETAEK
jgi:hypothetical protein